MTKSQAIKFARENKVLRINYTNEDPQGFRGERIIRIYNVGNSLLGKPVIRCYQYSGVSFKGENVNYWKLLLLDNIGSFTDLGTDQRYITSRPGSYNFSNDLGMVNVDFLKGY